MIGTQKPLWGELHEAEAAYYAEIAVHKSWHVAADRAMGYLAKTGREFTADDLRRLLDQAGEPATPNAYGGLMMAWARRGLIRKTGQFMNSTQPKRNGGVNAVWVGTNAANIAAVSA